MTPTGHIHCPASSLQHVTPLHRGFTVWIALGGFMLWLAASLGLPAHQHADFSGFDLITQTTPFAKSASFLISPDKKLKARFKNFDSALLPSVDMAFAKTRFANEKAAPIAFLFVCGLHHKDPRGPPLSRS